jgi:hypothetical protein
MTQIPFSESDFGNTEILDFVCSNCGMHFSLRKKIQVVYYLMTDERVVNVKDGR